MFSGQGSQYPQMGKELFEQDALFRETMLALDQTVLECGGESIVQYMYGESSTDEDRFERTILSHPAIYMVEYALAQSLLTRGVIPDYVLGSSLGEFAAAAIAGVFSAKDGLRCVMKQAIRFEQHCPSGAMLAILGDASLYPELPEIEYCTLVSVNYDGHFVISGSVHTLEKAQEWLTSHAVFSQMLPVSFAYHSQWIDSAEAAYTEDLQAFTFAAPNIPLISCMTGGEAGRIAHNHFWQVARKPILFREAIQKLESAGPHHYIDISPGGTLAGFVKRLADKQASSAAVVLLSPFYRDKEQLESVARQYQQPSMNIQRGEQNMRAYVFPGQGSQFKGMGHDVWNLYPDLVRTADEILGYSIRELCLADPGDRLKRTEYTQPALYTVNALMYYRELEQQGKPDYVAGHSLGEFNALLAAGVFDFATGLRIVQFRGELMGRAEGGGMAAVIGLHSDVVGKILAQHGLDHLDIANMNSPSQIVISGPQDLLVQAKSVFEQEGASNYVILNVSGAFHSRYMETAKQQFAAYLKQFQFAAPTLSVISNVGARPYTIDHLQHNMVEQLTSSVQWTDTIRYLMGKGVNDIVQIGPGTALSKLVKAIQAQAKPLFVEKLSVEPPPASLAVIKDVPKDESLRVSETAAHPFSSSRRFQSERMGSAEFRQDYGARLAYVAGGMFGGISSVAMITTLAKAGMVGFLGTGGLRAKEVEEAVMSIRQELPVQHCWGLNVLHDPLHPQREEEIIKLMLRLGLNKMEAKGFLGMTPALIQYRVKGIYRRSDGTVASSHLLLAKCSRPEVAELFMSPAPQHMLDQLLVEGRISAEQAQWAQQLPMADDICAEADCAGYTDGAVSMTLLPAMLSLRNQMMKKHGYAKALRVGAAGGIGTPQAAAAVFVMGADFILTGSINQCTVEANTSQLVKELLQQINVQDTGYAPAAGMFELGGKVQVLKKGVYFPARANKLHELYRQYDSIDEIDEKTKTRLQEQYFKRSFDSIYAEMESALTTQERALAERSPKARMAVIFKWYLEHSAKLALQGDENHQHRVDFQVYCGPALGAFNQWVQGTTLESWTQRHVHLIGEKLMEETAQLLNESLLQLV
ncbi:ACP S-malonyltransferase [Paenibacillus sp. FSL R5-0766]|uniref:ACP S-malonyltransferase n=1 Tax=unclassified Paenibacillus TaxID=185978 RepID=UPI0009F89118|nr:ACP S-malonyltransferase [Paenibacillus sp. FSL R5-0765]